MGKALPAALAEATQLVSRGSWVASTAAMTASGPGASHAAPRWAGWRVVRREILGQVPPGALVIALQLRRCERKAGGTNHRTRLEHERHGVGDVHGKRGIDARRLREGRGIRPVSAH